jgi:Flp pilus assembly pilin Flp
MKKFARLARFARGRRRRAIIRLAGRALRDERGGETLEYAVVAGLVVASAIAVIQCVGNKVLARWTSLGSSI